MFFYTRNFMNTHPIVISKSPPQHNKLAQKSLQRSIRSQAFTILEIMIVLAIMAVLAGAVIKGLWPMLVGSKIGRADTDIQTISSSLKMYEAQNYFLPTTEQGIQALVTAPTTDPIPKRWTQTMDQLPIDPWGMPYVYKTPGIHNPKSFDLYSLGEDRIESDDDIGNWSK